MRAAAIPFEVPWLATYSAEKNALGLHDKQGYNTWLPTRFVDGQRVMIIPLSLVSDDPHYHASAYRYWRGCVLPIIAEEIGEPNLDIAHDTVVSQLAGVQAAPTKRRGLKLKRKSTAMDSMPCAELCDLIDRAIAWATTDLGLIVPMADPAWKWKQEQRRRERRGAGNDLSGRTRSAVVEERPGRTERLTAPGGGQ